MTPGAVQSTTHMATGGGSLGTGWFQEAFGGIDVKDTF
jgi:hypothetical protein